MVTLSKGRYNRLVENDEINPNTYYFTYEGEEGEEGNTWHFGEPFPIVLTNSKWTFGEAFPIILTNNKWAFGGTFPVILR